MMELIKKIGDFLNELNASDLWNKYIKGLVEKVKSILGFYEEETAKEAVDIIFA